MLKNIIYVLCIALIFIIIAGEKNLNTLELPEEKALLPETENIQVAAAEVPEPVSFSDKLAAGEPVTIVFLGDYVTSPDSLPDGNPNHVALLANWFDDNYPDQVTVVNAGMNANTVSHMKDRVATDVLSHSPDLVVVSAGLNDALGGWKIPVEEYAKNYQQMVEDMTASGETEVLIRTPNPTTSVAQNIRLLGYMRASREVAAADGVHFFDFYQTMADDIHAKTISQSSLMQNPLLPNTKGQAYLFGQFKTYFTSELIQP